MHSRRHFLQQGSLALAGLGILGELSAHPGRSIYRPGDPIFLNANENAYGPSPMAKEAMLKQYLKSNRYPDDTVNALKEKLAQHWKVKAGNILMGAGSSEIIGLAAVHYAKAGKHVLTAEPAYKVWNRQAESFGLKIVRTPLTAERSFDLAKLSAAIGPDTAMVYICNPNNPTGTIVPTAALRAFANEASKKTIVFIDEAYTEYAGLESLADMAVTNPGIIVAKTYSKIYGLAGARVGYAIAHPETITALAAHQPWADAAVSDVAAAAASASLDDIDFVNACKRNAASARSLCTDTFTKLSLEFIPSHTNFMLFNISSLKKDLVKEMAARQIFVQYREHFGGKWCRVTMGTMEEMEQFCKVLPSLI
jgi:histidinol-phosphate aminotransferase